MTEQFDPASVPPALDDLAGRPCENFWGGATCATDPSRHPESEAGATGYCYPCLIRALPYPSLPTREQIAEAKALIEEADGALSVIGDGDWTWQDTVLRRIADHYSAMLALVQNGADR